MADEVNFFDQSAPKRSEPPPPQSEDDYGENVVVLGKTKKVKAGWKSDWHLSESGAPLPTLHNAMVAMRGDPRLANLVRFNDMDRTAVLMRQIPNTPHDPSIPRPVKDADVLAIQEEIQLIGLRRIAKATVQDAIQLRAEQDRYHPVREYLSGLKWDGKPRVDTWLSYYLGVEAEPGTPDEEAVRKRQYASKIGRLFLIALIARQFQPGCKADYMLILEGPQGAMKSSACRALAGEWFSDNLPDLSRGDAVRLSMHLRGKWLIEIAEMSSFNAAESHTLKEFLTQTEERYTPKYGRNEVQEPRQCLFIGSTNEEAYLRDATGARRFWPVKVGTIDIEGLTADRDQLLAEAVELFRAGEKWWPDREFEQEVITVEQEARYLADPWEGVISDWLNKEVIYRCNTNNVLMGALNVLPANLKVSDQKRVADILRRLKWRKGKSNGKEMFFRPDDHKAKMDV